MFLSKKNYKKGFTHPPTFKRKLVGGFTLVELLVTISIFVILTGVVLFSQTKFNSTILLTNLAYDTALTIRQAQNYGINVKEFDNGTGNFSPYGVHFELESPHSFILFADLGEIIDGQIRGDGNYDGRADSCLPTYGEGTVDGCVNWYTIKRGNYISEIRIPGSDGKYDYLKSVDIVFQRPNPDAVMSGINRDDDVQRGSLSKVWIVLSGADGSQERAVLIQSNGLIQIENTVN